MGGPGEEALVSGRDLSVNRIYWTVPEAVELLADAYWFDLGLRGLDPDPITLEALAWALNGHPEYREQVWDAWEDEMILAEWSPERRDQAQYWLDTVVIRGIAVP